MTGHFNDVKKAMRGEPLDSYVKYFATLFSSKPKPAQLREAAKFQVLWQGNPISTVKTFGSEKCKLCMQERIEILKMWEDEPTKLINSCSEIYGACWHKPKFHRFSTDECIERKRVTTNSFFMQNPAEEEPIQEIDV